MMDKLYGEIKEQLRKRVDAGEAIDCLTLRNVADTLMVFYNGMDKDWWYSQVAAVYEIEFK